MLGVRQATAERHSNPGRAAHRSPQPAFDQPAHIPIDHASRVERRRHGAKVSHPTMEAQQSDAKPFEGRHRLLQPRRVRALQFCQL